MTIDFNTIPANLRVPGAYPEMDNSQANIFQNNQPTLLIGQKLATGVATTGVPLLITSLTQAIKQVGRGSMLARMFRANQMDDPMAEVYMIAVDEPAAGVVAAGTLTIAGAATESGLLSIYIAGQRVQVAVMSGDTVSEIATNLVAAIALAKDLPVSAAAVAGVVTLTCLWKGLTGNDITIVPNYRGLYGGEETPTGLTLTIEAMSSGAGAPDLMSAITAMGDEPYDFIAFPFTDSASLDLLKVEMNDTIGRWSYLRQNYGHVYAGYRGTISELVAFGDTRNDQHATVAGFEPDVPSASWEYCASYVGRNAIYLKNHPARPTQTGRLTAILPAPEGKRFSKTECQILLQHGIATSYTNKDGVVRVERAITNYQSNDWGQDDISYLDSETLHTSSYVLRAYVNDIQSKYGRCSLADDGTAFDPGIKIVTPSLIHGELCAIYRRLERQGIVENYEAFKAALIVERDQTDPSRLNARIAPDYVNQFRIFAFQNQFRLQFAA